MIFRLVCLAVLALLALTPGPAGAQTRSHLPAFRSDAELARYLRSLEEEEEGEPERPVPPPCPAAAGTAQPGTVVRGRVTSVETLHLPGGAASRPLSGAQVSVAGMPGKRAVSNADGWYRIAFPVPCVSGSVVSLRVELFGYGATSQSMRVEPGDSAVANFALSTASMNLDALVVTGESQSITNVQHEGVDEGGIVKVHGDHLVMLRRGRLFTVAIGDRSLRPVAAVDAFGPGADPDGAWYDEMLVSGDRVTVIGYSNAGTELGVFHVGRDGSLRHLDTYHLRSEDYYSSDNYASRLVGNRLVLYSPIPFNMAPEELSEALPALRRWRPGAGNAAFERIAPPTRIFRPGRALGADYNLTLHTITTCDLARRPLRCQATGVLGPEGRVFYVSPTAAYVWVTDGWRPAGRRRAPSMLLRLPLDGGRPGALGVEGSPVNQLSFLESGDGHLNVLVREDGSGDGMWRAERPGGKLRLLRVSLGRFGDGRRDAPASSYRALPAPRRGQALENRFVGRHLLYGAGSGWGRPDTAGRRMLYAVRWAGGPVTEVPLPHPVDRIEGMGGDAVVVGVDARDLHFSAIALRGRPRAAQHHVRREASQGELRSHGFFYKPDATPGSGTLALPIRGPARLGYEHLFEESASVLFLRNGGSAFRELGELAARDEGAVDDGCVASCVDWYGNSRPIFVRGRIFALMGYEIVEGEVDGGRIRETRRVNYAPRQIAGSKR